MTAVRSALVTVTLVLLQLPAGGWAADRLSVGSDVHVPSGEVVDGDMVVVGADAHIDGEVRGDVVVVGGDLLVGPGAAVGGSSVAVLGGDTVSAEALSSSLASAPPTPASSAAATGENAPTPSGASPSLSSGGASLAAWAGSTAFVVVLGLLFLSTWPEHSRNLRRTVEAAPLHALLVGGLVSLAIGLVMTVLAVTVVGLLAWPLVGTVALAAWLAGITGVSEALGDRLPGPGRGRGGRFVLGAVVLSAPGLLWAVGGLAAFLGAVAAAIISALAVGATVISGLGRRPYGPTA